MAPVNKNSSIRTADPKAKTDAPRPAKISHTLRRCRPIIHTPIAMATRSNAATKRNITGQDSTASVSRQSAHRGRRCRVSQDSMLFGSGAMQLLLGTQVSRNHRRAHANAKIASRSTNEELRTLRTKLGEQLCENSENPHRVYLAQGIAVEIVRREKGLNFSACNFTGVQSPLRRSKALRGPCGCAKKIRRRARANRH